MAMRRFWHWLEGRKTYLLCLTAVLHGVLDWFELLPDEGSFDVGNTTAIAEIISALALMTFRLALAGVLAAILENTETTEAKTKAIEEKLDALLRMSGEGRDGQ